MEITFHQFGNNRILINKIFPMELVLEWCSFFISSVVFPFSLANVGKRFHFSLTTLVHGRSINQPPTLSALPPYSPHPPKPSPQGSVLHRWVCSDTLVRLKSQAGFINSYSGSMDTPFCIVTNTHINPLCPGVLQNYISSYMIKSDWLHSAFPLRLSEITVCIYPTEEQTPSPWWKQRWHEMLLKWLGIFSDKHISVCGHGFRVADDVSRDGVGEWRDWWQEREKVRAMRDIMCLWLHWLPTTPHSHPHPRCFLSVPQGRYVHLVSWLGPETPP